MKRRKLIIPFLLVLLNSPYSLSGQPNDYKKVSFIVEGQLSDFKQKGFVYLSWEEPWENKEYLKTDIINGKFKFTGDCSQPTSGTLRIVALDDSLKPIQKFPWDCDMRSIFICSGKITIKGEDSLSTSKITGGCPEIKQADIFGIQLTSLQSDEAILIAKLNLAYSNRDSLKITELKKTSNLIKQRNNSLYEEFIKSHPTSYLSINLLSTFVYTNKDSITIENAGLLWDGLSKKLKLSPLAIAVYERIELRRDNPVGTEFKDVELMDTAGRPIKISSFKGKYILLDFWASWCSPCRREFPGLKKLYQNYSAKGFEIIGISIDRKYEDWIKAIEKDELQWPQLLDEGSTYAGKAARLYKVLDIPKNFLINPGGKIIDQGLSPDRLNKRLSDLMK